MFRFFKEHSYEIVKLFLTQIGIAVFGLVMAFATSSNKTLFLMSSIFAAFFYWCLLYSEAWELGAKDMPRVSNGRMKYSPFKGVIYAAFSNSVNYILVFIMFVSIFLGTTIELFGNIYVIVFFIQRTISAMFMGINQSISPVRVIEGVEYLVNDSVFQPVFYLVSTLPSLLVVGLGYYMGLNDRKLFTTNKPKD